MNSVLQSLFMNTAFRQGLFSWKADDITQRPGSIIYQLQLLFGSLQDGMRTYYDPTSFTDQLELQVDVQQDVQEFNKALITFLEEKFALYPQPGIQHLVQQQFRGDSEYVTLCEQCGRVSSSPSNFYEIELTLENSKRIEDAIGHFTGVETMSGDNAYNCEGCRKRVNAKRCVRLVKLPDVLNFQLMRFQYDVKTGRKKKIAKQIQFPAKLDMRNFMQHPLAFDLKAKQGDDFVDDFDFTGEYEYELSSVLIHKGSSAYGGHYTALIRDEVSVGSSPFVWISANAFPLRSTGDWWSFDDATVTNKGKDVFRTVAEAQIEETPKDEVIEIEDEKPARRGKPAKGDAEYEETAKKPKRAKVSASASAALGKGRAARSKKAQVGEDVTVLSDVEENGSPDDTNERRRAAAAAAAAEASRAAASGIMSSTTAYMVGYTKKGRKAVEPTVPAIVKKAIEEQNHALFAEIERFQEASKSREAQHEQFKMQYEDLWKIIRVKQVLGARCNWISTEWLSQWVMGDVVSGEVTNSATANSDFVCEHNRIDPLKVEKMKRISSVRSQFLRHGFSASC